jgi:hypothetical protein
LKQATRAPGIGQQVELRDDADGRKGGRDEVHRHALGAAGALAGVGMPVVLGADDDARQAGGALGRSGRSQQAEAGKKQQVAPAHGGIGEAAEERDFSLGGGHARRWRDPGKPAGFS